MSALHDDLYSGLNVNGPAPLARPGPGNGGMSSDATSILQSRDALSFAARILRAAVKDKSYRATPIGGEVGRFLRVLKWDDASPNTLDSYETTLCRLSLDFADRELADLTIEDLRDFLDEHWGESASATRRQRLAAVKSFYRWAVKERGVTVTGIESVKSPKVENVERQAYDPDVIDALRDAQPTLRDQIGIQLLGRLALRRNELRLLQVGDFDLTRSTVKIHGKGGKVAVMPIGFRTLKADLEVHLMGRRSDEYLLNPQHDPCLPMAQPASTTGSSGASSGPGSRRR